VIGTLLSDQGADYQNVHHRQCTQYEEANLRVTEHGPYHSEVECGDGDANHNPGDSEASYFHGKPLVVE
jgi:hypothetical protein